MASIQDIETELTALKAARPVGGTTEMRLGDRTVRRDIVAQDARITQLEAELRRRTAALSRGPIRVRF